MTFRNNRLSSLFLAWRAKLSFQHCLRFAFVIFGLSCSPSALAEEVKEAQVILLAQEQDPAVLKARSSVTLAEAERQTGALYPNPSLAWDREHTLTEGPADVVEDSFSLSIPIDFSSRRRTQEHLAEATIAEQNAQVANARSAVVVRALALFYQVIAEEERSKIETEHVLKLSGAAKVISKRRAEGEASGYDQTRLEIERELANSTLRESQAQKEHLANRLSLILGLKDKAPASFLGSLELQRQGQSDAHKKRPSILHLEEAQRHAGDANKSSKNSWIPSLSIYGGPKIVSSDTSLYGYVAGITVDLPFFSRGQETRARAKAKESHVRVQTEANARSFALQGKEALLKLRLAKQEVAHFNSGVQGMLDRLQRAAESGYREGQRSIIELLDSQRTGNKVQRRRLALVLSAKMAELDLRAAQGEFE